MGKAKYKIIIAILSLFVVLLTIAFVSIVTIKFKDDKIEYSGNISMGNSFDKGYDSEESVIESDYEILIYFDLKYEKLPKYDEWIELYGLKKEYENFQEKEDSGYFVQLSNALYNEIKDKFYGLEYVPYNEVKGYRSSFCIKYKASCNGETVKEANEKLKKIKKEFFHSTYYKNLIKISKESYVDHIYIHINYPYVRELYFW